MEDRPCPFAPPSSPNGSGGSYPPSCLAPWVSTLLGTCRRQPVDSLGGKCIGQCRTPLFRHLPSLFLALLRTVVRRHTLAAPQRRKGSAALAALVILSATLRLCGAFKPPGPRDVEVSTVDFGELGIRNHPGSPKASMPGLATRTVAPEVSALALAAAIQLPTHALREALLFACAAATAECFLEWGVVEGLRPNQVKIGPQTVHAFEAEVDRVKGTGPKNSPLQYRPRPNPRG